jgi:hypothetical protein
VCGRATTAQALPGGGAALGRGAKALVAVAGGLRQRRKDALPLLCHGRGRGQSGEEGTRERKWREERERER